MFDIFVSVIVRRILFLIFVIIIIIIIIIINITIIVGAGLFFLRYITKDTRIKYLKRKKSEMTEHGGVF